MESNDRPHHLGTQYIKERLIFYGEELSLFTLFNNLKVVIITKKKKSFYCELLLLLISCCTNFIYEYSSYA